MKTVHLYNKLQGNVRKERKSRAFNPRYESPDQPVPNGFGTPFSKALNPDNRRAVLTGLIPRDAICSQCRRQPVSPSVGRRPLNPRTVTGSLIIRYMMNPDGRETVARIDENTYVQYFPGYSGFMDGEPFDASLLVNYRKAPGMETVNAIKEKTVELKTGLAEKAGDKSSGKGTDHPSESPATASPSGEEENAGREVSVAHRGRVVSDAAACPQAIAYSADPRLLSDARERAEEPIDSFYGRSLHGNKARTYRKAARKDRLRTARKKRKDTRLRYLRRDTAVVRRLPDSCRQIPFDRHQRKYFYVIRTLLSYPEITAEFNSILPKERRPEGTRKLAGAINLCLAYIQVN